MDRRLNFRRTRTRKAWASYAWPWAIIDACLVIVALLPAHDNKNGPYRIHNRNRWEHETPLLSILPMCV